MQGHDQEGKKRHVNVQMKNKKTKKTKTHNILTEVTRVGGFSKLQRLRKTRFVALGLTNI